MLRTKAKPIQFIDGKCHIKKRKSHKTALSGYYAYVSHDLLLMPSGADTHLLTHKQKPFQETNLIKGRVAWLKNLDKVHNTFAFPNCRAFIYMEIYMNFVTLCSVIRCSQAVVHL